MEDRDKAREKIYCIIYGDRKEKKDTDYTVELSLKGGEFDLITATWSSGWRFSISASYLRPLKIQAIPICIYYHYYVFECFATWPDFNLLM